MLALLLLAPATAFAEPDAVPDLANIGTDLAARAFVAPRTRTEVDVHGSFRIRQEALVNLDLDRGLDPSGAPLFTVPLGGGQTLDGGDLRAIVERATPVIA